MKHLFLHSLRMSLLYLGVVWACLALSMPPDAVLAQVEEPVQPVSESGPSTGTVYELVKDIAGLAIPKDIGIIRGFYPASNNPGENTPLIIYILEAHTNYDAQMKIAAILNFVIKKFGTRLVLVEGGVGDVSISHYRALGDKAQRTKIGEKLLKEGKFSAEEYVDLSEDFPILLWGVENASLYDENLYAFSKSLKNMEGSLAELRRFKDSVNKLSPSIFSPEHVAYIQSLETLEKGGNSFLIKKYQFLSKTAQERNVALDSAPHLKEFLALADSDTGDDFSNIQYERDEIIRQMTRKVPYKKLQYFIQAWSNAQKDREAQAVYFDELAAFCEEHNISPERIKRLKDYREHLNRLGNVVTPALIDEVKTLQAKVDESFLLNSDQKFHHRILRYLALVEKLFQFELVPEEYAEYREFENSTEGVKWLDFLEAHAKGLGLPVQWIQDWAEIEKVLPNFEGFYKVANLRDQVMAESALKKITVENEKVAALIAGGFHKDRLVKKLNNLGLSVLTVAPRFEAETDQQKYYQILQSRWEQKKW